MSYPILPGLLMPLAMLAGLGAATWYDRRIRRYDANAASRPG